MQNPKKKLAEYIIQNKQKFTKKEIQKAQQLIDRGCDCPQIFTS